MDYQWARNRQEQELLRELELRKSDKPEEQENSSKDHD